jgi:hypothetical protein
MKIRGTEVAKRADYAEEKTIEKLHRQADNIQQIVETPERGMKTYMRNRIRDYKKTKRSVSNA